jgi:hypothetical protein
VEVLVKRVDHGTRLVAFARQVEGMVLVDAGVDVDTVEAVLRPDPEASGAILLDPQPLPIQIRFRESS